jgi:trigger factor
MVERYVGRAALMEEALELLVPEAYSQAVAEQGMQVLGQPQIEILQIEPSVSFKATVALEPTVNLGDYSGLHFEQPAVEVVEEEVEKTLQELREQNATWEPVDRPVQYGDLVTMDIESEVETEPDSKTPFIRQEGAGYVPLPGDEKAKGS